MLVALATFAAAALVVIFFPGPDTLVVLRAVVRGGRARGAMTAAGVISGLAVWVAAAALGLAALLKASEAAYDVLRILGACYLVWLGAQSLRAVRTRSVRGGRAVEGRGGIIGTGYLAGLITNLLNPKVGVFFVTFLPGFVPHGYPLGPTSLLLGAVFVALTIGYFSLLLAFATRLVAWLRTPRLRRRLDAVTGVVLVGIGIRLAVET